MVHTGKSAFEEVNEKVSQAGEILGIKPEVVVNEKSLSRFRCVEGAMLKFLPDIECNIPVLADPAKAESVFIKMSILMKSAHWHR